MIKKIIFDLDNTLIMWKDEYKIAIKETLEEYKIDIDYNLVDELIEKYEMYYNSYKKENFCDLMKEKLNLNINIDFIDRWLFKLGNMSDVENNVIETLEYLHKKYELVILTNWFKNSQVNRLKKANIYHYFKEIYSGEEYIKPQKESFKIAVGNNNLSECIMVGDNLNVDIKGALNFGIKPILIDVKNKYSENSEYLKINDIKQLKEIL